jgi:hypothetical protein
MSTPRITRVLAAVTLAGLVVGGAAVNAAAAPTKPKPVSGTFVGTVSGTDAYVAVVAAKTKGTGKRAVLAYVCDSQQLADWFTAKVTGNHATLKARNGDRLTVDLAGGGASGILRLANGTRDRYSAAAGPRPAGLYQAFTTTSGTKYLGGWIALADGTQRGAIKTATTVVANPVVTSFTTSIGTLDVPTVGTVTPKFVDPITQLNSFINPIGQL